ncbi:MAG: TAT-variant-translocated molybdopterin oxidoreductase [Burkholderiaceae bacterium]|nr:TAT-variant-translocated molybdopterin oxidoreductase [Burkholderiaceae bacterium]
MKREQGRRFWRSLEEAAGSEDLEQWLLDEFPRFADALPTDRRDFLRFLGASLALGGLSGCGRPPQEEIVPYVHGQEGQVAGVPRFFASALNREGYAQGVLVESHMGRPTKIEGNPRHPASLGATDIHAQASVLQMWDPDRSQVVLHSGEPARWDDFAAALVASMARFDANEGAGLRVLTGTVTSPTLAAQLDEIARRYPRAHWHAHQPCENANALAGARLAFGAPMATRHRFDRARCVLALDADFLTDPAAGVRNARDFVAARDVDARARMNRLYVVEATPSLTGAMADHRLPLEAAGIEGFARQLAQRLDIRPASSASQSQASSSFSAASSSRSPPASSGHERWLDALAADLQANRGSSLVVVGRSQPPSLHALAHAINAHLGNVGRTLDYCEPIERVPGEDGKLADLVAAMNAGEVDTLFVLGANPVYDAPSDLAFADAAKKVAHLVHLGLYRDETAELAEWHLPQAHELESWADLRAWDGTASVVQPLIAPLYDAKSSQQLLAMLLGDFRSDGRTLVRAHWQSVVKSDFESFWTKVLQTGVVADTAFAAQAVTPDAPESVDARAPVVEARLELLFRPDPTIGDGSWANNGWLQELPKPLTQLTWDNPALVSPALAARHGLSNGQWVELRSQGRSLAVPVWIMPGQAPASVTLHLGYGRRRAGRIGDGQGFDAYALRTSAAPWIADDLELVPLGGHYELAGTQHHFLMQGEGLVRTATLEAFLRDPHFVDAYDAHAPKPPSLYRKVARGQYAWGMSIDLNACIGCKACTIACQAENNIPVVGKDQVQRGREMHWIRVDHYYEGEAADPRTVSQPVPCMMCERAPCEVVCPVGATVHDHEGLNVQVYNRCVGTRFCSNNCPYKVRRFNFLQYADRDTAQLKAQRNPQVSVRRRGVMEKCTYCIQRIQAARIVADREHRHVDDGEVRTACQAVCPTQAIRFGDMSDPTTDVSRHKASARNYVLLDELDTRPRTSYLARIRNPNPDLDEAG